jgi:type I restriction enzyme R subunit
MDIDKKQLSERDICTKYITPAIAAAGWNIQTQVREECSFTDGRIIVRGNLRMIPNGEKKRADYILYYQKNKPIAVIEAKNNRHKLGDGMQQALLYAECLDVPFVFSSNGDGFLFHDKTGLADKTITELKLEEFPSPETLWQKYCDWKQLTESEEKLIKSPYYDEGSYEPRYYQINAINRCIEAIAKGQNRLLLVMATGTGKTYTAFQIIWRLWKAKSKKRILFLADRNILVDQAKNQDFAPFGDVMTKIKKRQIDKNFDIYLSLYQAVTGNEEKKNIYKQFSPAFFDLVIVDECHRGSADENSAWHEILEYFNTATHIGLTATPKETKDVSTSHYFGEPIYTYSLRQGIEDGFLAPYKVIRIITDKDANGYTPEQGKTDKYGNVLDQRTYGTADFDRKLVLDKRTELVARKVWEYLQATDPMAKTIVFCDDQNHAERMRQALVNIIPAAASNRRYVMRITGEDKVGKAQLFNFIAVDEDYPVIATTSKLLSTGVDAKTCKLIVLDQNINSMTEFKQIIGRGTRLREDYNKFFFTIMDFKNATRLFADAAFDGDPVVVYEPKEDETVVPPENEGSENKTSFDSEDETNEPEQEQKGDDDKEDEEDGKPNKFYLSDVSVTEKEVITKYLDKHGKLVIDDLRNYSRNKLNQEFGSLKDFLRRWSETERKEKLLAELEKQEIPLNFLKEVVPNGNELDIFDLITHIAFDQKPLTRSERVKQVRNQDYFSQYNEQARAVLDALLDKYTLQGVRSIENPAILDKPPFDKIADKRQIRHTIFGSPEKFSHALTELENALYQQRSA